MLGSVSSVVSASGVCVARRVLAGSSRGLAYKHVRRRWQRPHSLADEFNLRRRRPDAYEEWTAERQLRLQRLEEAEEDGEISAEEAASATREVVQDISGLPERLRWRAEAGGRPPELGGRQQATCDYQRACVGRLGAERTGLDVSVCWPDAAHLADRRRMDEFLEGGRLAERLRRLEEAKAERRRRLAEADARIDERLAKMPTELQRFSARQLKAAEAKEAGAEAKRQLLEEARDYFGFRVDPRDEKFHQLQELKAEEAKKLKKEQRKAGKKP